MFGPLLLQGQQPALYGTHRGAADIAVLVLEGFGVIADVLRNGAQIFKIKQQQSLIVGNAEDNIQHAGLHVVEVKQTGQQQRAEIGDGGAHRVAFLTKDIPHYHRIVMRRPVRDANILQPFKQFLRGRTFLSHTG